MLVSKLDVDDVISWFSGAVGHLTGSILLVLSVDVHLTGPLDRQAQATIACITVKVTGNMLGDINSVMNDKLLTSKIFLLSVYLHHECQ